jgi:hypothetical protein
MSQSHFFSEHIRGASTLTVGGANTAKTPKTIEFIFANRVPDPIKELFAAAEAAGPGDHIPISEVDETLAPLNLDIEKRLQIKAELRALGAIA